MSEEKKICPFCGSPMPAGAKVCQACGALVEDQQKEMRMAGTGNTGFEGEIKDERLRAGTLLNKGQYRVESVLGQGGFGITYECRDLLLGRRVAIKEYFPVSAYRDPQGTNNVLVARSKYESYRKGLRSFKEEGMSLSAFQDVKEIVSVFTAFEENMTAYIVMELLEGETLQNYLKRNGKLGYRQTLAIIEPVMTALEYVHSKGLIHRDVKPSNIMILRNGDVKLLDFGCAREANYDGHTVTSMYTQSYAPPEQKDSHGVQGPFTDVYSLCATIFDMMAGGIVTDTYGKFFFGALSASGVPRQAIEALKKGLDPDYKTRTQSIAELRKEFCIYEEDSIGKGAAMAGSGNKKENDTTSKAVELRRAEPVVANHDRNYNYNNNNNKKKSPVKSVLAVILVIVLGLAVGSLALFIAGLNKSGAQEEAVVTEYVEESTQTEEEVEPPVAETQTEEEVETPVAEAEDTGNQTGVRYITSLSELSEENWTQLYNACKDQEKALQNESVAGNIRFRTSDHYLKALANLRYINAEFVTVRDEENKRANNNSYEMSEYNNMLFVSYTADITDTGDNTYTGAAGTLLFGNVMIDETGTLRFEKAFYSDVYATVTDMDAAVIGNFSNNYTRDNSVSLEGWN